jgi:hypothetical protein
MTPASAPTSGSMLRNAPATAAGIRLCPKANSVNGASVPASASAATASTGPDPMGPAGAAGAPSATTVKASAPSAAPRNCTAVTATGSRSASSRPCATVNVADSSTETSTSPSPPTVAPPPLPPAVIRPTPPSETAKPSQASGRATARCHAAAMTATSTGTAPISRAAWVTLVRVIPAFCTMTVAPYPIAPETRIFASSAPRPRRQPRPPRREPFSSRREPPAAPRRRATGSSTAAARPKRATVSQPGASHCRASLDSGTVVPHSSPAAMRAATA